MQFFYASAAFLGFLAQFNAEGIIGYDGQEHHWHPHRDGLHDHALHEVHRRHDLSHPRLRRFDHHELPHMLNQGPIVVSQRNLHITSSSHKRVGFGASEAPKTLAAAAGSVEQEAAIKAMKLSRTEVDIMDSVYGESAVDHSKHAAKRDQGFHFRVGHKQSEQHAAEDMTAQEVARERNRRMHKEVIGLKRSVVRVGGPPAAAGGAPAAAGDAPSPAPMGSPALSPASVMAEEDDQTTNDHFTMDEDIGASEQGFSGKVVEHDNMKTMTHDWRGEYGPGSGVHSYEKICAMYPDNQWCHDRGYHRPTSPPKSAARSATSLALVVTAFCGFFFA